MPITQPFSEDAVRATGGIAQIFATPVGRLTHPYGDRLSPDLAALVMSRLDPTDGRFTYKKETAGNLAQWGEPLVEGLSRWVLKAAHRFVEDVTGQKLVDPSAPSPGTAVAGNESAATNATDAPPALGGGCGLSVAIGNSWASLYLRGDYHPAHLHPNTAVTAIYYVKAPDWCELHLMDPRPNIDYFDAGISLAGEDRNIRLRCRPGDLVLIPGWLKHAVPAFEETSPRISISWNLGYTAAGT
ncbi:putative 2OG-Fe(II) oxygenase [Nonomuraea sp. NPDC004702]